MVRLASRRVLSPAGFERKGYIWVPDQISSRRGCAFGRDPVRLQSGGLELPQHEYDWLVISGAKAQYKGSGTINDAGDFAFIVTAIDGHVSGGGGTDTLRMKIWDKQSNQVIYDNQLGAADNANPTTPVHGSVVL